MTNMDLSQGKAEVTVFNAKAIFDALNPSFLLTIHDLRIIMPSWEDITTVSQRMREEKETNQTESKFIVDDLASDSDSVDSETCDSAPYDVKTSIFYSVFLEGHPIRTSNAMQSIFLDYSQKPGIEDEFTWFAASLINASSQCRIVKVKLAAVEEKCGRGEKKVQYRHFNPHTRELMAEGPPVPVIEWEDLDGTLESMSSALGVQGLLERVVPLDCEETWFWEVRAGQNNLRFV